jgi:hypothetical protein
MSEQTRWEYQVLSIGSAWKGVKEEQLQDVLNEVGSQGWEVVSVYTPGQSPKVIIVARRPLTVSTRRQRSMP